MSHENYTAYEAIQAAREQGCVEINQGAYLHTRKHIRADQAAWGADHPAKMMDFSDAPYWITEEGDQPCEIYGSSDVNLIMCLDAPFNSFAVAHEMAAGGALDLSDPGARACFDAMTER